MAKLKTFFDSMTKKTSENISTKLAEFMFACNLPFRVVDSIHFKRFVNAIRPFYIPPTQRRIANRYLNNAFETHCQKEFNPYAVLLIDGWTNDFANTKNVTAMLHTSDGKALFLESFDLT